MKLEIYNLRRLLNVLILAQFSACTQTGSPGGSPGVPAGGAQSWCPGSKSQAGLRIDDGAFIYDKSRNPVDGVMLSVTKLKIPGYQEFAVNSCTASAVSSSTLLTAAHCVYIPGPIKDSRGSLLDLEGSTISGEGLVGKTDFCVRVGADPEKWLCSDQIYIENSAASSLQGQNIEGNDYATVVFPPGSFSKYFKFYSATINPSEQSGLMANDNVLLVGYSPLEVPFGDLGVGSKRFGFNKVKALSDTKQGREDVISKYDKSFNSVGINEGDSGGPLIYHCRIAGVASRFTLAAGVKNNVHTNLTNADNRGALLDNSHSYICGLSDGKDDVFCPPTGAYVEDPNASGIDFPCVTSGDPLADAQTKNAECSANGK